MAGDTTKEITPASSSKSTTVTYEGKRYRKVSLEGPDPRDPHDKYWKATTPQRVSEQVAARTKPKSIIRRYWDEETQSYRTHVVTDASELSVTGFTKAK